jgi:DNA-binding response OmpR family regulator
MTATLAHEDGKVALSPRPEIRVVACEDQALMRDFIVSGLTGAGIQSVGVCDGAELDAFLNRDRADIIILDIGLPGEDGYSIATRLRQKHPHLGIIMLTARDHTDDKVQGMDCGADLYFTKTVGIRELASAVRSLHRRLNLNLPTPTPARWRLEDLRSCLTTPSGIEIALTDNELRFLIPLFDQPGAVIDRDRLSQALDQVPDIYAMRRMETMLSRLRAKVQKASPDEPLPIRARHGRGYAFLSEAEERPATSE